MSQEWTSRKSELNQFSFNHTYGEAV